MSDSREPSEQQAHTDAINNLAQAITHLANAVVMTIDDDDSAGDDITEPTTL